MTAAGQVGGAVSPSSCFNLNVNSKPNPLGVSGPDISWTLPSPCKSDKPKLEHTKYKFPLIQILFQVKQPQKTFSTKLRTHILYS